MQRYAWIAALLAATTETASAQVLNLRAGGWDLTVKEKSGGEVVEVKTKICLKEDLDAGAVFRNRRRHYGDYRPVRERELQGLRKLTRDGRTDAS